MNLICVAICLVLLKPFAEFLCGIDIALCFIKHNKIEDLEQLVNAIEQGDWLNYSSYVSEAASEIVKERSKRG